MCYLPPETSSREMGGEEALQSWREQVAKFHSLGSIIMCGDFNARCGMLDRGRGGGWMEWQWRNLNMVCWNGGNDGSNDGCMMCGQK